MAVVLGHAVHDENGKIRGGKAGDQTGSEVTRRDWYNNTSKKWHTVLRPKDSAKAEIIAKTAEQGCDNNNIGYDQDQRTTLFKAAQAVNFILSAIKEKCETDCSAYASVCANAAGIKMSPDVYSGDIVAAAKATGAFELLTSKEYVASSSMLKRGDILVKDGHVAIVLNDGPKAEGTSPAPAPAPTPSPAPSGTPKLLGIIKRGMIGGQVKDAQTRLKYHKAYFGKVDGIFGGSTYNAVVAFQAARIKEGRNVGCAYNHNRPDGIIGEATWNILWE